MRIVAIVGMTGSGKSEASSFFKSKGFPVIRFGDVTDLELKSRGLETNEKNEKMMREQLRKELGMDAYAKKNLPRIKEALKGARYVFLDGVYSWEEYIYLKKELGDDIAFLAIYTPPRLRYDRLMSRKIRPLKAEESQSRDKAELENLNKGGPIAMADYTIDNSGSRKDLIKKLENYLRFISG
jgi:dephospho-CoA kinase